MWFLKLVVNRAPLSKIMRVRVRVRMWNNDLFFLTLQWANLVCFKLLE